MSLFILHLRLCSVEHIVGNLVMQLLLGIPLELVHKGFEVGMIYMAGVLAGQHHLFVSDPVNVALISTKADKAGQTSNTNSS